MTTETIDTVDTVDVDTTLQSVVTMPLHPYVTNEQGELVFNPEYDKIADTLYKSARMYYPDTRR